MAEDTVIVVATDLVRQCVDFSLECWPRGAEPAGPLRFRLVGGESLGFLVVDVGHLSGRLQAVQGSAVIGSHAPSHAVLPLAALGLALERLLPEEARRAEFVEALALCLNRWSPIANTPALNGLRAVALQACAAAMPSRPRLAGCGGDAAGADRARRSETSLEALFRTLHYCRLQVGALA